MKGQYLKGTQCKQQLERQLALAHLANVSAVQKQFRSERQRGAALAFCDLRELVRAESAIEEKGKRSPIPFHGVLSEVSPFYARVFFRAEQLGLRFVPTVSSYNRLIEEFEPFGRDIPIPPLKAEIRWQCAQPLSSAATGSMSAVANFNFSVIHEALHKIFYVMIPPTFVEDGATWRNYFLLIESLVGVHETILAEQMGRRLALPLRSLNSVYRALSEDDKPRLKLPTFTEFSSNLLTHLGKINGWSTRTTQSRLPEWAPYDDRPIVGYAKEFSTEVVPTWLSSRDFRKPKAAKRSGIVNLSDSKIDATGLIDDPATVRRLYILCHDLFYGRLKA